MPAVRITKVIPIAMMPLIDTWRRIFIKFTTERKLSLAKARNTTIMTSDRTMP